MSSKFKIICWSLLCIADIVAIIFIALGYSPNGLDGLPFAIIGLVLCIASICMEAADL